MKTSVSPELPTEAQTETAQRPLEAEVAALLVDVLHLEIGPDAIEPTAPLFREGLGLDSIDALELSLALSRRYGVVVRSDDARNAEIFASLRSLASFLVTSRTNP